MFNCSKDIETITHLDALAIYFECQAHFREWFYWHSYLVDTRHKNLDYLNKVPAGGVLPQADVEHGVADYKVDGVLHHDTGAGVWPGQASAHLQNILSILTNTITFLLAYLPAEVGVQAVYALGQLYAVTAANLPLTLITVTVMITVIITGHSGHLKQDQVREYHWWEQIAGLHVFWVSTIFYPGIEKSPNDIILIIPQFRQFLKCKIIIKSIIVSPFSA